MKKLSIIFTIMALMLSIVSAGVHACEQDNNIKIIKSNDFSKDGTNNDNMHCTQCSCHHHGSSSFFTKSNVLEFFAFSAKSSYEWANILGYSQLYYPPSKPPKV